MSLGPGLPWLIFGNPDGRRVQGFQEALARQGRPAARVVPWLDVLDGRLDDLPDGPHHVRLESPGEDPAVERAMLVAGYADALALGAATIRPEVARRARFEHGQLVCPRQAHCGFERALARLAALFAERPAWRIHNPPDEVSLLFDKRRTSPLYAAAGIPVPPRRDGVDSTAALRAATDARRVFVKLSCGSSASGLAVLERDAEGERLWTTIELTPRAWYNSLQLQAYSRRGQIDGILAFLLGEGAIVEEEVEKATLDGHPFDCRVVVIGGEPSYVIVRQNRHLVTNLHLLGWRGSLASLAAAVPADARDAAWETCRAVGRQHRALHVGVDLMFAASGGHCVLEANAFGDLLPNLTQGGLPVYDREVLAADGAAPPLGALLDGLEVGPPARG